MKILYNSKSPYKWKMKLVGDNQCMKNKSISINAVLNGVKTLLQVVFPLITFPYAAKVLGVDGIGKYNFSYSIVSYFMQFSALGIYAYAVREGSAIRNDRESFSAFSSEIIEFNIISMVISYVLLTITCFLWDKLADYNYLIFLLSTNIILTTLGCEWVYAIYEEYFYITVRGIVFQIISMILLFTFVDSSDDLIMYSITTITSASGFNILNIIGLCKRIHFSLRPIKTLKQHFKPIMLLFANSIATTIYVNSDTTILGLLSGDFSVGLYSVSTKVYSIVKAILASIIIVSIPRMSNLWASGNRKGFESLGNNILITFFTLSVPATIGIYVLSEDIIRIISDESYLDAAISMKILSVSLLTSVFNWFFQSAVLIPSKNEKKVLYATGAAALINIVLNFVLIPFYAQDGAAFTTLLAEMISVIISGYYAKKIIKIRIKLIDVLSIIVGCFCIYGYCVLIKSFINGLLLRITFAIIGSVVAYLIVLVLFRNSTVLDVIGKIRLKVKK